jgi:hypothetical protein
MKLKIKIKKIMELLPILSIVAFALISCQPDQLGEGNGLSESDLDAGFTISVVSGVDNTYLLTANASYMSTNWDLGLGTGFYAGGEMEEIFYPDSGIYEISHAVLGKGGSSSIITQQLNVELPDPLVGNLIKGGEFEDVSDHSKWTVLNISEPGSRWIFNEGSATIIASGGNQGIYQAIEVVANKEYTIDMLIAGNSNENFWFQVYASTVEPIQMQDYGSNKVMGLDTWEGCGTGSFNGLFSTISCQENSYTNSVSNVVTFDTSGTAYLVIKSGGDLPTSVITIRNVEMRGTK